MKNLYFAVWKPKGITSNHLLNRIRRALGSRKVGHAGTLDPLAEGVLVVATGHETPRLTAAVSTQKEYIAAIRFGETSTTDDAEGIKTSYSVLRTHPAQNEIENVIRHFVGDILQTPPIYSALKVGGTACYARARAGEAVHLPPRPVRVDSIAVIEYAWPQLILRVMCGKGVYIRSLARDIGEELDVGGYLEGLSRTRVGEFTRPLCVEIDALEEYLRQEPDMIY